MRKPSLLTLNFLVLAILVLASIQNASAKPVLDFDGDGKTDQAIARREGQKLIFYVNGSMRGVTAVHWSAGWDFTIVNPFS